jgi:hypothetical protein
MSSFLCLLAANGPIRQNTDLFDHSSSKHMANIYLHQS